jgi:hypothetical protein
MNGSKEKPDFSFNLFVGPNPIETGRKIFGRDREIDELYYLLSAERIVMLHPPSGAGKTLLIQAGLIPRLTEHFDVWGRARVNKAPSKSSSANVVNRYILSAALDFERQIPAERRRSSASSIRSDRSRSAPKAKRASSNAPRNFRRSPTRASSSTPKIPRRRTCSASSIRAQAKADHVFYSPPVTVLDGRTATQTNRERRARCSARTFPDEGLDR